MEVKLTDSQWEYIQDEFGGLFRDISRKISGDRSQTPDDYVQEMSVSVLEAIRGFYRQGTNGEVEDFIGTPEFGKYLKSCLWNRKNTVGRKISDRYHIHRDTVPIQTSSTDEETSYIEVEDKGVFTEENLYFDFLGNLSEFEETIFKTIVENPSLLFQDGRVDILRLSKALDSTRYLTEKALKGLGEKIERNF